MSVDYAEVVRDLEERKGQIEAALVALRPLARAFTRVAYDGNGASAPPRTEPVDLSGTPHTAIPTVDLAAAIAARTTAGDGPKPRTPRDQNEIDAILDQTRKDVAQMSAEKRDGIRRVPEGQGPGQGYRVCKHCRAANGVRAPKCIDCGKTL